MLFNGISIPNKQLNKTKQGKNKMQQTKIIPNQLEVDNTTGEILVSATTEDFNAIKSTKIKAFQLFVGTHLIWPPDAFALGHRAHQHLAN